MRIRIAAIGQRNHGAEVDLTSDYLRRFNRHGQQIGLGPCDLVAFSPKRSDKQAEAVWFSKQLSQAPRLMALDARGKQLDSDGFARLLAAWRDADNRDLLIIIGGADGLADSLCMRADFTLSFGAMIWPHLLARVMLAEQLYRAASILTAGPYHRG